MLTVRFFAGTREALDCAEQAIDWDQGLTTVNAVKEHLVLLGGDSWREALYIPNLVHAVNQRVVDLDAVVKDGDEIAFFPPMTGG